jgi:hypothetical protein
VFFVFMCRGLGIRIGALRENIKAQALRKQTGARMCRGARRRPGKRRQEAADWKANPPCSVAAGVVLHTEREPSLGAGSVLSMFEKQPLTGCLHGAAHGTA